VATQSIILLNNANLVRDMLQRVINKAQDLQVVADVEDVADFPKIAQSVPADWTILLLDPEEQIPESVVQVIDQQSAMRLMIMAVDGSQVMVKNSGSNAKLLNDKNLLELLQILRREKSY
jgi:hypothetical protein